MVVRGFASPIHGSLACTFRRWERGDQQGAFTGYDASAFVFEVFAHAGNLATADPDALVTDAQLFAPADAIALLERLTRQVIPTPFQSLP